jgi:hypothetical protein
MVLGAGARARACAEHSEASRARRGERVGDLIRAHLLIEGRRAAGGTDVQLFLEDRHALFVLAQRAGPVAGQVVQAHQLAVGALARPVAAQAGLVAAVRRAVVDQLVEHRAVHVLEPLALENSLRFTVSIRPHRTNQQVVRGASAPGGARPFCHYERSEAIPGRAKGADLWLGTQEEIALSKKRSLQ